MKKQLFKSGTNGILLGLAVSMVMFLILAQSYMPLNTHSAVGQWITSHQIHGSIILAYCLITWFAIGILFEVASYIFRKAEWSLLRETLSWFHSTSYPQRMAPSTFDFLLGASHWIQPYLSARLGLFLLENEKGYWTTQSRIETPIKNKKPVNRQASFIVSVLNLLQPSWLASVSCCKCPNHATLEEPDFQ